MVTKALPKVVLAALLAIALPACSTSTGSGSAGGSPAVNSTPAGAATTLATTAAAASDTLCPALSDVKSAASTLKSDLQSKNLSAVRTDISNLETTVKNLVAEMSAGAQQDTAVLQSAWDNVKNTFQGLSKSDLGQVQSKMQGPIDQLETALESTTSGLHCS